MRTLWSQPLPAMSRSTHATPAVRLASSDRGPTRPATLSEPTLFYAPPYATRLADAFAWDLVKYLVPVSGLQADVRLSATILLDFLIEAPGHRVGIQLGRGAEGTAIVPDGTDVLVRIDGDDLLAHMTDALYLMAGALPGVFSARGRLNLERLASMEARAAVQEQPRPASATVTYPPPEEEWTLDGEVVTVEGGPASTVRVRVAHRAVRRNHRSDPALALA